MISLRTNRLWLREHRLEDLRPLRAMLSDPALTYYLPSLRHETQEETARYLEGCLRDAAAYPRLRYNLAVCDVNGALVGSVGLHLIDGDPDDGHYGLGFFIQRDRWNQGYAAEAVGAALDCIFARGAARVSASALAENLASRRVLEKCGFVQEGLLRRHTWHDGAWRDCAVYGRLKDESEGGCDPCFER